MSFIARNFHQFGNAAGILRMDMMGEEIELPYRATFYIDSYGEIACAAAQMPDGEKWLFLSRNADGNVYTQSGRADSDLKVGKNRLVTTVKTDRDGILASHMIAVGDGIVSDTTGLKRDVARAPQKAADLAVQAMKLLVKR